MCSSLVHDNRHCRDIRYRIGNSRIIDPTQISVTRSQRPHRLEQTHRLLPFEQTFHGRPCQNQQDQKREVTSTIKTDRADLANGLRRVLVNCQSAIAW
jgi:hypothetical protein